MFESKELRRGNVTLRVANGHFATTHSHINYYIDITNQKIRLADAIRERGLPAAVSLSAGAFVCNDTLYRLLLHFAGTDTRVGFIHVPFLPSQAKPGVPSMSLEEIVSALEAAISALDR